MSRGLIVAILAGVLAVAGCSEALQTTSGIVISVDSPSAGVVDGFVLRTSDGRTITFSTRATQFDRQGFPPQHLREHQALATPVQVTYRPANGANEVVKLEDAPTP